MAKIIKELTLDVVRENIGGTVAAKQNDVDSRSIKARITADRKAIDISQLSTVVINVLRPDGESNGFVGTVNSDGTVSVPISAWMLKESGTVKCDISVFDGTERLTTMPFFISVEESLYDGEAIENEEEYTVLSALMNEMYGIRSDESLRVQIEEERVFAENERESAEGIRETNEAARTDAEAKREAAEGIRKSEETYRAYCEDIRQEKESLRTAAEERRTQNEEAREYNEYQRAIAEGKRTTFIPYVSEDGIISWTNDKGLDNPEPISLKGEAGYTPIRGSDYWTETDKNEIISEVLSALPSAEGGAF